jgi:hypothetical protein
MGALEFNTALLWLQTESGLKLDAQSGQVRLRDAEHRELLILESLGGGHSTALWASINHDVLPELAGRVGLHLLHLCADLDALGPVKITRIPESGRCFLVYSPAQAEDASAFVTLCSDMIAMAQDISDGLTEISLELADEVSNEVGPSSLAMNSLVV